MGMGITSIGCCNCGTPYDYTYFAYLPSCFCTEVPDVLRMASANEAGNNGMFRTGTITYQSIPPEFAPLHLGGDHAFLGDQTWPDPLLVGSGFRYLLTCRGNQFTLTRLYPTSPYGSPYRDSILYSWLVGGVGNTCFPFHLDNGLAFPGSDPTCSVTIDAA